MTDRIEIREFVDILRRAQRGQYLPGLVDGVCDAAAAHLDSLDAAEPAPPSPSVAALREAARSVVQFIARVQITGGMVPMCMVPMDELTRLSTTLAASNANARGGDDV